MQLRAGDGGVDSAHDARRRRRPLAGECAKQALKALPSAAYMSSSCFMRPDAHDGPASIPWSSVCVGGGTGID